MCAEHYSMALHWSSNKDQILHVVYRMRGHYHFPPFPLKGLQLLIKLHYSPSKVLRVSSSVSSLILDLGSLHLLSFFMGIFWECFIHFIKFWNNELLILLIFFLCCFLQLVTAA